MRRTQTDWRRRARRVPGRGRLRFLVRSGRILTVLLAATGCAVEPPRPTVLPPLTEAPSVALTAPPVLSRFGEWRGEGGAARPARHAGIDIRATTGTPVLAAADGVVLRTGSQAFAGRLVVVAHDLDLATAYYHLSSIEVTPGQPVRRGDLIGRAGASGNATAPHLHFGVCRREDAQCGERIDDGWVDPARFWLTANPCFVPGQAYASQVNGLTYPVPCQAAPGVSLPVERGRRPAARARAA